MVGQVSLGHGDTLLCSLPLSLTGTIGDLCVSIPVVDIEVSSLDQVADAQLVVGPTAAV